MTFEERYDKGREIWMDDQVILLRKLRSWCKEQDNEFLKYVFTVFFESDNTIACCVVQKYIKNEVIIDNKQFKFEKHQSN